jgi:REP element-mobilizing transposase RayT
MKHQYDPDQHHRRSIRLKGYDYSQPGWYFITICCQDKVCRFGDVEVNFSEIGNMSEMVLNEIGEMIKAQWLALKERFINIELHEFIIMPNHFHGILEILDPDTQNDTVGAPLVGAQNDSAETPQNDKKTLSDMVDAFKSITTVEYIRGVKTLGWPPFDGKLWQRNYYEHIIRNEKSYYNISNYIVNNPAKWHEDKFYPQ